MLGCIFDVHGNLPALEAVLADARSGGVERFVLGGDYAAFGAWPRECAEAVDALDAVVRIRGNWERWVADPPPEVRGDEATWAGASAVRDALGDARVEAHGRLPDRQWLGDTFVCHASPVGDMDGFPVEASEEEDARLLRGIDAPRLFFGHTHHQFRRMAGGVELVNPGSVGMPVDGDRRAAWAVLYDDGTVELRRVEYDVDAPVAMLRERYGDAPWHDVIAKRLITATF